MAQDYVLRPDYPQPGNAHPVNSNSSTEPNAAWTASTGHPRPTPQECAKRYKETYADCVAENTIDDAAICGPDVEDPYGVYHDGAFHPIIKRPTLTTPDGRNVDCRDYRRFGENATTTSVVRSESTADTRTDTESRETAGSVTVKSPSVPGMATVEGSVSRKSSQQQTESNTQGSGVSRSETVSREAHRGWQQQCNNTAQEAYDTCRAEK
jgi:hypothetical protein